MELVAEARRVQFFDDSKGTNVGAVIKSLESYAGGVILIAGGKDKGGDFAPVLPLLKEKVKTVVLIGEAREKQSHFPEAVKAYEQLRSTYPEFETIDMATFPMMRKASRQTSGPPEINK